MLASGWIRIGWTRWSVLGVDLCGLWVCFWGQGKQDPITVHYNPGGHKEIALAAKPNVSSMVDRMDHTPTNFSSQIPPALCQHLALPALNEDIALMQ